MAKSISDLMDEIIKSELESVSNEKRKTVFSVAVTESGQIVIVFDGTFKYFGLEKEAIAIVESHKPAIGAAAMKLVSLLNNYL